jgi:hypothetical protein
MLLGLLTTAPSASAAGVLDGLTRLAVIIEVMQPVGVSADDLRQRFLTSLAALEPDLMVAEGSADRLQLAIAVRSYSSSELRGFPLPFSGAYAVGTVRLTLHRAVQIVGGPPGVVSASVWERERHIATRSSAAARAVHRAMAELLDDFVAARRASR